MSMTFTNSEWYVLDISAMYEVGTNIFSITCRSEKKDVTVEVTTEGSRDLGLTNEASLALSYTSAGRSNMEVKSSKETWNATKATTGYDEHPAATLTGFNW
mgnify:FL=1